MPELLFEVDGINHELPAVAGAFAFGTHARCAAEFEVNDAPFARRHRIETEGLAGFARALGAHTRRKLQFRKARGSVFGAIEPHAIVKTRVEPQPAMRDVIELKQQLGFPLQQKCLIGAAKRYQHVCFLAARLGGWRGSDFESDIEAHLAHREFEKSLQLHNRALAIQPRLSLREIPLKTLSGGRPVPGRVSLVAHSFFLFLNLLREGSGRVRLR